MRGGRSVTSSQTRPEAGQIHQRVLRELHRLIESPEAAPGDRIPSERTLAEELGVSRMTVRRAVDDLVRLGQLERRSTSGTHITSPSVTRSLDLGLATSFTRVMQSSGARPGARLLFFEARGATRLVAEHLQVAVGTPLIVIRRLRTANGLPIAVETSHLPADRVTGLVAADLFGDASLFALLRDRFHMAPEKRRAQIGVVAIGEEDAEQLGLRAGTNVLSYRLDVFDRDGRPIEYMISVNHPQRVTFVSTWFPPTSTPTTAPASGD
jgi:GntR family transcriptional regulator